MALVHVPNGTEQLNRYPAGDIHTSACEQFQAGDSFTQGTNPLDVTCPLCLAMIQGRAEAPDALLEETCGRQA